MSTRTERAGGVQSSFRPVVWVLVGVAIVATAAAFMAVAHSNDGTSGVAQPRAQGAGAATNAGAGIGSGYALPGGQSAADVAAFTPHAGLVTGTGPGLVQVATRLRARTRSVAVTGTGPGLEVLARRAWQIRLRVAGTGPDLRRIAGW